MAPEAINFFTTLLSSKWLQASVEKPTKQNKKKSQQNAEEEKIQETIPIASLFSAADDLKPTLLLVTLDLIKRYCGNYTRIGFDALPEAFEPLVLLLKTCPAIHQSSSSLVKQRAVDLVEYITRQGKTAVQLRKPLEYLAMKPVEIKSLEPMLIHDGFNKKGSSMKIVDPDKQRLQHKVLLKKTKREKRAVVRELKRDNQFLQKAREQELSRIRFEQKQKMKKVMGDLHRETTEQVKEDATQFKMAKQIKQERKKQKQKGGNQNQKVKAQ